MTARDDFLKLNLDMFGQEFEKLRVRLDANPGDPSVFCLPLHFLFNDVVNSCMSDALLTKLWVPLRMAVPALVVTAMSGLTRPGIFLTPSPRGGDAECALYRLSTIYYEFDPTITMPAYVKSNIERAEADEGIPRPFWGEKWGNASLAYQARLKRLWDQAMARAFAA